MAFAPYDALKLEEALTALDRNKWKHTVSRALRMAIEFYFVAMVVSMFIGFLNVMSHEEMSGEIFFKFIRGFMLFVLSLVLFSIIRKTLKDRLQDRGSALANQVWTLNGITLVLAVAAFFLGYIIGTSYLGGTTDIGFFIRWIGGIGSVFLLLGPYMILKRTEERFVQKYKSILFGHFLPAIAPSARYAAGEHIARQSFTESKLFPYQELSSLKGSDLITRADQQFQCSHLDIMQVERTQSNGKSETKYSQLFKGYFLSAAFNKSFSGETYVLPDGPRAVLGEVYGESFNTLLKRPGTNIARMEDPDFEQAFSVFTSDQQEARYILSPKLMERILHVKQIFTQDVYVSFIGHQVYVAVQSDKDLFSPPSYGHTYKRELVEKQYSILQALVTIPELFDLDRKIWGS